MVEPRPGLRDAAPYRAPQTDAPVRLNTNECPYALPEGFAADLAEAVRVIPFNRYPDREASSLRQALAEHTGHPQEAVWAANGSNEIIEQLLLAYGGPGRSVVLFEPTYLLHGHIAWTAHSDVVRFEMPPPFVIGEREVRAAAEARPTVVFVCSPNNPTGNAQPREVVEELVTSTDALVIVDEAYIEFGGKTAADLVASHPNLVVVRTFSKAFALAAARIGYCLASSDVIGDLERVRLPYHLSALAQAAGAVALRYASEAMSILDAVRRERDRLFKRLSHMAGVEAYPSDANFVLFRPPRAAAEVWQGLLDRGVLVRDLSQVVPGCLRVTAGTTEEVGRFLESLEEILR
jgi:histidinol-phosphate aminotransferase